MSPAIIFLGSGVLLVLVSAPLVIGLVPLNNWYGVRLPCSLRSPAHWSAANKAGGWVMLVWGVVMVATAGVIWKFPVATVNWLVVLVVMAVVASAVTFLAAMRAAAAVDGDGD